MSKECLSVPSVAAEFTQCKLGHARRTKRLCAIAKQWSRSVGASVPRACQNDAAIEGTYRFLNNPAVSYRAIVDAHTAQTCERLAKEERVIVAHDTTEFRFGGETPRHGLGVLNTKGQGFLAHVALAMSGDGHRRPLGVVGFRPWTRPPKHERADLPSESERWWQLVDEVEAAIGGRTRAIHVMDREADIYSMMANMVARGISFVVRLRHERTVVTDGGESRLREEMHRVEGVATVTVPISRRGRQMPRNTFTARDERVATIRYSAMPTVLKRPGNVADGPKQLRVNVVRAYEVDAPDGVEPIEWHLITSEPIGSVEEVIRVVDVYRSRWLIEEYFKALKSGCAVEKRQHESLDALLSATAICLPIAWQLLALRTIARAEPRRPATDVLSTRQLTVLRALARKPLSAQPTVEEALYAVAALGGHMKRNGPPGWQTLGSGLQDLIMAETGWAAREALEM